MEIISRDDQIALREGGVVLNPCQPCCVKCGGAAGSGGFGVDIKEYTFPEESIPLWFTYDAYSIPDRFVVYSDDEVFLDTEQPVSGTSVRRFTKPAGLTKISVRVEGDEEDTAWSYSLSCKGPPQKCPEERCWFPYSVRGCSELGINASNGGKTVEVCYQDSVECWQGRCGEESQSQGCASDKPCDAYQHALLTTPIVLIEPVQATITVEGRLPLEGGAVAVVITGGPRIHDEITIRSPGLENNPYDDRCEAFEFSETEVVNLAEGCNSIWFYSTIDRNSTGTNAVSVRLTIEFDNDDAVEPLSEEICPVRCSWAAVLGSTCIGSVTGDQERLSIQECLSSTCYAISPEGCDTARHYCCSERKRCHRREQDVCQGNLPVTPAGTYETLYECRQSCRRGGGGDSGFDCINDVCTESDNEQPTYATIEECEQACLGRFACDSGECIQTGLANSPHANRAACEQVCQHGYACAPNGSCYRVANGPYATLAACEAACVPGGDGGGGGAGQYFCISVDGQTRCRPAPLNLQPNEVVVSGPHNGILECSFWCQRYSCVQTCNGQGPPQCVPAANGQYATRQECLAGCTDPARLPCTLQDTEGVGPGVFPFAIDAADRTVCVSYASTAGQPVQVQAVFSRLDPVTCLPTSEARVSSGWRGLASCDCRDVRPPGALRGGPSGNISFRKPHGVTQFWLVVLAPCPDTEVQWTVRCSPAPCTENAIIEPSGACCIDGECVDGVKAADCLVFGGQWLGECTTCEPGDCTVRRGACCYPDGACLEKTQAQCAADGGVYQGDGVFCFEVQCPVPPRGACCIDGECVADVEQQACINAGGIYQGDNTDCFPPDPCGGACCWENSGNLRCTDGVSKRYCLEFLGGTKWLGTGTVCADNGCIDAIDVCDAGGGANANCVDRIDYLPGSFFNNVPQFAVVSQSAQTITVPPALALPVRVKFCGAADDGIAINGVRISNFNQVPPDITINERTFEIALYNDGGPAGGGVSMCFFEINPLP